VSRLRSLAALLLLGVALVATPGHAGEQQPDVFAGPGFMLDTTQWTPFYIEDGVYFCIIENGKFTCATVAKGSVLLIPTAQPDSTQERQDHD